MIFTAIGMAGCACYIASYFLVQIGRIDGNDYCYVLLNLIAASLLLISLTQEFNLSSATVQIFWIMISIVGIARKLRRDF